VPIYMRSGEVLAGKATNLAYPVGDLTVLFALVLTLLPIHQRQGQAERAALGLLIVAITCLVIADSWFTIIDLSGPYVSGGWPDVFWMAAYLLVPLAGLVHLYLRADTAAVAPPSSTDAFQREDILQTLRFLLPLVVALLASGLLLCRAIIAPVRSIHPLVPLLVTFLLSLLVIIRQSLLVLEHTHLQRERAAARANEQVMREMNRRMDTFLSIASHEMRTPLTTLTLQVQLARRQLKQAQSTEMLSGGAFARWIEHVREHLSNTETQIARLSRLINELLDDSRIQASQLNLYLKPECLAEVVRKVVEEYQQIEPERTILLRLPPEPLAPLMMDADRIGQVVTNFLSNALKYSQADCPIEAGLRQEVKQEFVWVRDQGPGISAEAQVHIWERFYRVAGVEVQSGTEVGLGLGLHICKTIIEEHGGQVGVTSAPGEGATFWFMLPLEKDSPPHSSAE